MIINKTEFKYINDILIIILIIFVFSVWFYSIQSINLSQGETIIRIYQNSSKVHQSLGPFSTEIETEIEREREGEREIINLLSTVYTDLPNYKRDFNSIGIYIRMNVLMFPIYHMQIKLFSNTLLVYLKID